MLKCFVAAAMAKTEALYSPKTNMSESPTKALVNSQTLMKMA